MQAPFSVRRMLLAAGLVAILLVAALAVAVGTRPGSFRQGDWGPYLASAIRPSGPQNAQDTAVSTYYDEWKSTFVRQRCGARTFQVYSPDAAFPYVAEAQGYGLIIAASMADADVRAKAVFDGIVRYVVAHPSVNDPDLMAAEQNSDCTDVGGGDSATDGDMDIAYALLLADRQWEAVAISTTGSLRCAGSPPSREVRSTRGRR